MSRSIAFAAAWVVAMLGAGGAPGADLSQPADAFRAPYLPSGDAEVLQEVPSSADPQVREMLSLRKAFEAAPQTLQAAERLATAYVDFGRQIGDAHYAGYAEAVIAPWLKSSPAPAPVLVTQATILQFRHQFDEAREFLGRALRSDPQNAQGWLTLATLDMVQGEYQAAGDGCAHVANTAGVDTGLACFASVRSYTGKAREALVLLQQVDRTTRRGSAAYAAWIEGLLAEVSERLGDWAAVESHYRSALQIQPADNFLLVAYADFLLDRGRAPEVLTLLADHAQSDTAFLRLALALTTLHDERAQRYAWIMAARFEALRQRGSEYFGREESRFALDVAHDPESALDLALQNWRVQRAPWDARVVLEAALAANRPDACGPVLKFLEKTRLEDPMLEPLVRALHGRRAGAAGGGR